MRLQASIYLGSAQEWDSPLPRPPGSCSSSRPGWSTVSSASKDQPSASRLLLMSPTLDPFDHLHTWLTREIEGLGRVGFCANLGRRRPEADQWPLRPSNYEATCWSVGKARPRIHTLSSKTRRRSAFFASVRRNISSLNNWIAPLPARPCGTAS